MHTFFKVSFSNLLDACALLDSVTAAAASEVAIDTAKEVADGDEVGRAVAEGDEAGLLKGGDDDDVIGGRG